ncbi:MAG: S1 RNA-binding domain-containing protein [Candidatus Margulisbacteria bacterium]|nr:S1 RNA-binding domain-containing protein [Candidatus Margulisiibacteriota bacterium]
MSDLENTDTALIGKVFSGVITHVAAFGAFVKLDIGEEGLVHISEVANEYVTDITKFASIGQKVTVKILMRNKKNKLEFSIKKATESEEIVSQYIPAKAPKNNDFDTKISAFLKKSEEKQVDIRRNLKSKQGIVKKRSK